MESITFISDISNNLMNLYKKENYEQMVDLFDSSINTILMNDSISMDSSLNEDLNTFKIFLRNKIKNNINKPHINNDLNKAQNIESTKKYIYIYYFIIIKIIFSVVIILFLIYYSNYYNLLFKDIKIISNPIINKK